MEIHWRSISVLCNSIATRSPNCEPDPLALCCALLRSSVLLDTTCIKQQLLSLGLLGSRQIYVSHMEHSRRTIRSQYIANGSHRSAVGLRSQIADLSAERHRSATASPKSAIGSPWSAEHRRGSGVRLPWGSAAIYNDPIALRLRPLRSSSAPIAT